MDTNLFPAQALSMADLLPHSAPMILLDSVMHWDEHNICCLAQSHLQPDNPLREAGILSVFAGIEYAAQAMAAHARLLAGKSADITPDKGFLAVASKLSASADTLDCNMAPLQVNAQRLAYNADSSLYGFSLTAGDKILLAGQLTAVLIRETNSNR